MADTTSAQAALQLADSLTQMLSEIGDFYEANKDNIDPGVASPVIDAKRMLSTAAGILYAKAAQLALDQAANSIAHLKAATDDLNKLAKKISKVQNWLTIAGAACTLAAKIIALDVKGIGSAAEDTVTCIQAALNA